MLRRTTLDDRVKSACTMAGILQRQVGNLVPQVGDMRLVRLVTEIEISLRLLQLALIDPPQTADNVVPFRPPCATKDEPEAWSSLR